MSCVDSLIRLVKTFILAKCFEPLQKQRAGFRSSKARFTSPNSYVQRTLIITTLFNTKDIAVKSNLLL